MTTALALGASSTPLAGMVAVRPFSLSWLRFDKPNATLLQVLVEAGIQLQARLSLAHRLGSTQATGALAKTNAKLARAVAANAFLGVVDKVQKTLIERDA